MKTIAVYPMNAFFSINIKSINHGINDEISWSYSNDDEAIFTSNIEYNEDGEAFFVAGEANILISECPRI